MSAANSEPWEGSEPAPAKGSGRQSRPALARLPFATTLALAFACMGCGACVEDHPSGGDGTGAPTLLAARELRGCGTLGFVPGDGRAPIVEIPSLGGRQVFIEDLNDDGVAVGGETTADGNMHAIRFTDLGGVQDLGGLSGFGAQSYASAIASDGTIAGHADHADGSSVFFGHTYSAAGGRSEICAGSCSVWDLNGRGQAVGLLPGRDPTLWQAFIYTPAAGLRTLGTLGGARSSASGISETGVVVGNAQLEGMAKEDLGHAFIYDSRATNPQLRDLNVVFDAQGWILQAANDVNESFIVGNGLRGATKRGFRIDIASGKVQDVGTLPGGGSSTAWGVDAFGDVVGWAEDATDHNNAFVFSPRLGGMRKLGDLVDPALGWQLVQANAVNAHGMIVGWGYHNGAPGGFKLALPVCVAR
jgi:probable HAF family extracellular repeat protein